MTDAILVSSTSMDAIQALTSRSSSARLTEPAPSGKVREIIFQASLSAPDHAGLKPWRFLTVEGDQRAKLGEKMLAAALLDDPNLDAAKQDKLRNAAMRAPLLVIAIAKIQAHPKVPEIEQLLATGAAVSQMLVATHALGFAAIWRTGAMAFSRTFMQSIDLDSDEQIVGFVYIGTVDGKRKTLKEQHFADFYKEWQG
jgi:nitroreductase